MKADQSYQAYSEKCILTSLDEFTLRQKVRHTLRHTGIPFIWTQDYFQTETQQRQIKS